MRIAHCRKAICYRIKSVVDTQVISWLVFKTQAMLILLSVLAESSVIKIYSYKPCVLLVAVAL